MILYFVCVLNSENDLYISKQCLNSKTEDFNYNLEFSQFLSRVSIWKYQSINQKFCKSDYCLWLRLQNTTISFSHKNDIGFVINWKFQSNSNVTIVRIRQTSGCFQSYGMLHSGLETITACDYNTKHGEWFQCCLCVYTTGKSEKNQIKFKWISPQNDS